MCVLACDSRRRVTTRGKTSEFQDTSVRVSDDGAVRWRQDDGSTLSQSAQLIGQSAL